MATPTLPSTQRKNDEPGIRKIYVPAGPELDILRHTYTRFYNMRDNRQEFEKQWDTWQKQWDSYRPVKGANDWQSNIYIPMTSSVIEAMMSEIVQQNLRPWIVERGAEDAPKAKVMNAILDYTWEVSKSDLALYDIIKDALIFGTGIGQEYYWKQPRDIKMPDGKTKKVLEFDDCFLEPVSLYDFYIDERGRDFFGPFQAQDAVRRYVMDYEDFRTFFQGKVWDPKGNAAKVKPGGDTNYYQFYKPPERLEHDREVEVLWYWNKPEDELTIVANDVVVVTGPNPYRHKDLPFVRAIDVKRPYQFYGKGEPELLESLQEEANTLRRQIIDRNHLDLDKPVFVSDTLTIEDDDTIAAPHRPIPVGDVNGIKFPEYSDIAVSVFKSLDMINDDKIRVTGMDERQESVGVGATATEAAILKEATMKRISMKIWHIKNDTIVDIGRLRMNNIMQFYSQPKLTEIVGEAATAKAEAQGALVQVNGKKYKANYRQVRLKDQKFDLNDQTRQPQITPSKGYSFFEAVPDYFMPSEGSFDVRFKATESVPISKPLQQQKADEMYDRLIKNPTVDPWKLAEYVIKTRDQDPDDFKRGATPQTQPQGVNPQKMIDLAGVENAEMMQGKPIKPTPYASVVHTETHVEFMKSDRFKKEANDATMQLFANHVMGEIAAQKQRGEMGGMPNGQPPMGMADMAGGGTPSSGGGADMGGGTAAVNPDMQTGGQSAADMGAMQGEGQ